VSLRPYVVDFETEAIEDRPNYPPKPVGVSIKTPGQQPRYYAWGHPMGNNCTKEKARLALEDIWRGERQVLFHNAKFDLDVAQEHMGLPLLPWHRVHDTLFLVFLKDPHALDLGLKPSAERILGMAPEERDAVRDWLVEHGIITKVQHPGPYIARCDGRVVARYANGDVDRTIKLFDHLHPKLDEGELRAYDRERQLMPILLANERQGIRFDAERAAVDLPDLERDLAAADIWLRKRLGAPDLNFDADADVAEALARSGVVTEWVWTKGGNGRPPQRSVAKGNLTAARFKDPEVFNVLGYRNKLQTVLANNLRPWLAMAEAGDGRIFTSWNQVRGAEKGTRTGRLSCSRFQNIVKTFDDRGDGWVQPAGFSPLPLVRSYLLPDKGDVFCHRDYNQQEFRILAHYEDDLLRDVYRKEPDADFHNIIQTMLKNRFKVDYGRRAVKTINFGILYGMGAGLLAARTGLTVEKATLLRRAVREAVPGVAALEAELKRRGQAGEFIRTWGGRKYYCEPSAWSDKHQREMTYEYKLLNYLVQGSAADCTKEALIRYDETRQHGRLLVTVHDEINISVAKKHLKSEMLILKAAMEGVKFDVPMITDGKTGASWGDLKGE
jgi:DNA polymerase-1